MIWKILVLNLNTNGWNIQMEEVLQVFEETYSSLD